MIDAIILLSIISCLVAFLTLVAMFAGAVVGVAIYAKAQQTERETWEKAQQLDGSLGGRFDGFQKNELTINQEYYFGYCDMIDYIFCRN